MISSCSSFPFLSQKASPGVQAFWLTQRSRPGEGPESRVFLFHDGMGWGGVRRRCAQVHILLCRTVVSAWEQEVLGLRVLLISRCRYFFSGAPLPATQGVGVRLEKLTGLLRTHSWNSHYTRRGWVSFAVEILPWMSGCLVCILCKRGHGDMGMAAATGHISATSPVPD